MKRRWLEIAGDLIFPRRCPFCGEVTGGGICAACAEWAGKIRRTETEISLSAEHDSLDFAAAVFWYQEPVRSAILAMKNADERQTARTLAQDLRGLLLGCVEFRSAEALIPVPASSKEWKSRGYTVPMWLAEFTARDTGLAVRTDLLFKIRETERQAALSGRQRRKNLKGAFRAVQAEPVPETVILMDDVFTTGSTLNECAKALKRAGVKRCMALTLAVTKQ